MTDALDAVAEDELVAAVDRATVAERGAAQTGHGEDIARQREPRDRPGTKVQGGQRGRGLELGGVVAAGAKQHVLKICARDVDPGAGRHRSPDAAGEFDRVGCAGAQEDAADELVAITSGPEDCRRFRQS